MKFHCVQCKTRYSIADDKVRGKILKIRCKNCSAVITIREPRAAAPAPAAAAAAQNEPSALHGAFSRAMQKPPTLKMAAVVPPATPAAATRQPQPQPPPPTEEWYLSVAGGQEGPFELAAACRRVSQILPGEEMFAWQETFDDWLPVEEVAQLRASVPVPRRPVAAVTPPPPAVLADDSLFASPSLPEPTPSGDLFDGLAARATGGRGEVDHRQQLPDPSMDFALGDVSRVIRMPFAPGKGGLPGNVPARRRGAAQKLPGLGNGATARAGAADALTALRPGGGPQVAFGEQLDVPWTAPERRRSTGLMLLVAAGVLLVAAAGVLIYMGTRSNGTEHRQRRASTQFASDYYNNDDPEGEVVRAGRPAQPAGTPDRRASADRPKDRPSSSGERVERARGSQVTTLPGGKTDTFVDEPINEVLTELTPDEVYGVYQKNSFGMKWCYNRILKQDPEIKVPKMSVTVTINPLGKVKKVNLPRQGEPLGVCLTDKIRRWHFRKSTGEFTTQFELVFQH